MRTVLLLLAFALPAASVSGAELVQHRGIRLHPEQFKTPQLADEWIAKIAAARLNAVYPLVWYRGGIAWFKSRSCSMAEDVPEGFDPLGYLVTVAHARTEGAADGSRVGRREGTPARGQMGRVSYGNGNAVGAAVYRGAKAAKPQAQISAAVFFKKESADAVCQDWYGWLREGCIDYVLPMAYTENNATLAKAFDEWKQADPNMERIIPGLSIYSRKEGKAVPRDLDLIRSQFQMCRTYQTHGNQFFSLAYLTEPLINELADTVYRVPARPWYPPKFSEDR